LDKTKLTLRDIALFGILGALTFGAKVAMSFLPNIEPTSLLVMVYVVVFGRKALYPIYLYVALEILFYGIQLWNINYL
jgi:energy-coupling factor transport system substrate-specific component